MGFFDQRRQRLGNVQHTQPVGSPIPVASAPAPVTPTPAAPFNYNAPLLSGGAAVPVAGAPAAPFNYNAPLLHPMNSVPGLTDPSTTRRRPLLEAALRGDMRSGWLGLIQNLMLKARQEGKL